MPCIQGPAATVNILSYTSFQQSGNWASCGRFFFFRSISVKENAECPRMSSMVLFKWGEQAQRLYLQISGLSICSRHQIIPHIRRCVSQVRKAPITSKQQSIPLLSHMMPKKSPSICHFPKVETSCFFHPSRDRISTISYLIPSHSNISPLSDVFLKELILRGVYQKNSTSGRITIE